jgi:hypothetical protein
MCSLQNVKNEPFNYVFTLYDERRNKFSFSLMLVFLHFLSFSTPITTPTSYISMCSLITCFFQKTCIIFFVVVHKTLAQIPLKKILKSTSSWTTWHITYCMVWRLHELIFSLSWTTTKKLMLPYAWYKKNFRFFD